MVEVLDVGSLPFVGDWKRFSRGVEEADLLMRLLHSEECDCWRYFEEKVVECFINKVQAGIDVPNYPQFRGMSEMFLSLLSGVEDTPQGFIQVGSLGPKFGGREIPEVAALRSNARTIAEITGRRLRLKVCVTGPYTLASSFYRRGSELFGLLADAISSIVEASTFRGKHGGVEVVSVDEPLFGILDDPLVDYGQEGREALLRSWEHVFSAAKAAGARTCMHLHATVNDLFWEVRGLEVVESHAGDPMYCSKKAKQQLEEKDKFLKASIAVTDFDSLVRGHVSRKLGKPDEASLSEIVRDTWIAIGRGSLDPSMFIEDEETIRDRLRRVIAFFGRERVAYAGPECGLRGFPKYDAALELLRRVARASHSI